jgi:hypothetical protein
MKTILIKIIKGGLLGFFWGSSYAFISFYLVTPMLHKYVTSIAGYGLQGLLLGVIYVSLKLIFKKIINNNNHKILMINMMIGTISGVIACSLGEILSYYKAIVTHYYAYATDELKMAIISRIIQEEIGYALIGLIVGLLIGLMERKTMRSQTVE